MIKDCNTCKWHIQGANPMPGRCKGCLAGAYFGGGENFTYLPRWEAKEEIDTMKYPTIDLKGSCLQAAQLARDWALMDAEGTVDMKHVSPHAVVTDFEPLPGVKARIVDGLTTAECFCGEFDECTHKKPASDSAMRGFATGATRTNDAGRIDPEAFLSPAVLLRYCAYMNRNRVQADGNIRAGDNWQKGIPIEAYRKSIQRHNLELWSLTRDPAYEHPEGKTIEDVLCALLFNVMGMLFEQLKEKA
jgi:hypothetical protein